MVDKDGLIYRPLSRDGTFHTTHWSVVLTARQTEDSHGAADALELLCRVYWYPVYAYLRRGGWSEPDAQDLAQGFFAELLERRMLDRVAPEKGRFRSFLLASLRYYVSDHRAHARRQKRGGGCVVLSLDAVTGEERYRLEPHDERTPDQLFERRWAMELLDRTLAQLGLEYSGSGQAEMFAALQPFLAAKEGGESYAALAARLGKSEDAVKKSVQRMRRRYQELFRQEIARTVSAPEQIEDELRHLCEVMSSG